MNHTIASTVLALLTAACAVLDGRPSPTPSPAGCAARMASAIAQVADGRPVTLERVAPAMGADSTDAQAMEEVLASALLETSVALTAPEDAAPAGAPRAGESGALSLSGELRPDGPLTYLRLRLDDPGVGLTLWSGQGATSSSELSAFGRAARIRWSGSTGEVAAAPEAGVEVSLALHLIARRDEESFTSQVEIAEGATLRQGDRLQIRFRTGVDAQVYAFLFRSDGVRKDLFPVELVYAGRLQYGPSSEGFVTLSEPEQVYTLYIIAAKRLEDFGDLYEDLDDLVRRSQVDRFDGLDKVDAAIASFLQSRLEGASAPVVQRGTEGIEKGEEERWLYQDGQVLATRPELLSAQGVLIRAISFEVVHP